MSKAITLPKGITIVNDGTKIVTYLPPRMKGKTLKRMQDKTRLARQVLTTVTI